ncbi:zinc-binding dehydrogenase [Nocardia blacklockiae]|uniref:zinc-binding dehydrogenase n=1 Tax=Nocardia blacklockiae TaxID=480036 RepID=UPI00189415D1|nr:zinc-binding dehydrogenase [Nocardia blacklockiae]MBF6176344.1 zinc-binding dehydrogenase [Nocardia blacklockiae]
MHAIRLHAFGPAENLRYEIVDDPEPGPGQVRIAVAAAGVHFVDTSIRSGEAGPFPLPELPTVPGREVAGTVDRLGSGVDEKWLGATVVAHLGVVPGGYAELAVAKVEQLHEIPGGLDPAAAVAMIGTGRTTLGILQFATLRAGDLAIVTAAAGGIGTLLVQYLKNAGLTVVGLAGGPGKTEVVAANGADLALDYRKSDWAQAIRERFGERPAALLFDGVGGETARTATDLLAKGGTRLIFGWSSGTPLELDESYLAERGIADEHTLGPKMLDRAGGLRNLETRALTEAATGRLHPAIQRFPLAEAAAAHHALETRATIGKVILVP